MTLYCRALIHPIIIGICARFSDNKDFVQSVKIFIRSSGDSNKYPSAANKKNLSFDGS